MKTFQDFSPYNGLQWEPNVFFFCFFFKLTTPLRTMVGDNANPY